MAFLKVQDGEGRLYEIAEGETTIGRAPDNVISLDDPSISSRHCTLTFKDGKARIKDLGSTNGTKVNGTGISEAELNAKDMLKVGSVEMIIDGEDIAEAISAPIPRTVRRDSGGTIVTPPTEIGTPAAFEHRKSRRGLWIFLGIVVGLVIAGLLFWFLSNLFAGA